MIFFLQTISEVKVNSQIKEYNKYFGTGFANFRVYKLELFSKS